MKRVRASGIAVCFALSLLVAEFGESFEGRARAQETKIATLRADAKAKPTDAAASFALGRALRRAGKFVEAKSELTRAATFAKGEDAVRARYEIAVADWESGKSIAGLPAPPSLSLCKQVKVDKLGEALMHTCMAEAWLTMERTGVADDELTAAEKIDPNLYEAKLARVHILVVNGKHEEAATKLKAITAASPSRAEGWLMLGRQYLAQGKPADAVAPLRKAKELDGDWPEVVEELSRALPTSGLPTSGLPTSGLPTSGLPTSGSSNSGPTALAANMEARDLARQAVAMRVVWPAAWMHLGDLEIATGGFEAAKTAFETSIKQAPKLAPAHGGLAWALVKLKKYSEAKKAAQDSIALAANDARARMALGEAHAGLGEVDDAVESFKLASTLDSKDPTGFVRATEVLLDAKQPMKAEPHAEAAVKAFPDDARTWNVKGDTDLANGDKKAARESYKKALAAKQGTIDKPAVQKKLDSIK